MTLLSVGSGRGASLEQSEEMPSGIGATLRAPPALVLTPEARAGPHVRRPHEAAPAAPRPAASGPRVGVEPVRLRPASPALPLGPLDFEHALALPGQRASGPLPIAARALDRPGAAARCVVARERERSGGALLVRSDQPFQQGGAARAGDERKRVLVAMRVHPDDEVQLVCKHLLRPPVRWG